MSSRNIAAIHDRIDEEHFEVRLHAGAIDALQQRVIILEAAIRELRVDAFGVKANHLLQRNTASQVSPLQHGHARPGGSSHARRMA